MTRFLKVFILFFVIFFLVEKISWYFINEAPKNEYDKRLENIVKGNFDKDVIILGSSRGANNVLACQLTTETGLDTYNFSYRGTNIVFQEFILKTYLKFNKAPKKVLLFLDHKHTFKNDKTLNFRYDRLLPLSKYDFINNELIHLDRKSYASKFLGLLRVNRKDFNLQKKESPTNQVLTDCGSMPNTSKNRKSFDFNENAEVYKTEGEKATYIKSFRSIQNLCKEHNIELNFVFSPNLKRFDTNFYNRFKDLVISENKIIIYDTLKEVYTNKNYFYDSSHLLKNGAAVFTSEISTFINSNTQNKNE